jgi:hypothetical protein
VEKARVLHRPDEPMPRAPQLHLLVHFGEHRPTYFGRSYVLSLKSLMTSWI